MRDKQVFDSQTLGNGIRVYHYPEEVGFGVLKLIIPVGTAHTVHPIPAGGVHFLEHMVFHRSATYPEKDSFERAVGIVGGIDAETCPFSTKYTLIAPEADFPHLWAGLFEHVFNPVFVSDDIVFERKVIAAERREYQTYYPSYDQLGQYIHTGWMRNMPRTLAQDLGMPRSWQQLTPETLRLVHGYYFQPGIQVVSGGTIPLTQVVADLHRVATTTMNLPTIERPMAWARQDYHTFPTPDVSSPILYVGGIACPKPSRETLVAISLLGKLMTDHYYGPLVDWLRRIEGNYSISFQFAEGQDDCYWFFRFGLSSQKQVARVRQALGEIMATAFKNPIWLETGIKRILAAEVYDLQNIGEIVEGAEEQLEFSDRIRSVAECRALIKQCGDIVWLRSIYQEYFANPVRIGAFCAVPFGSKGRLIARAAGNVALVTKLKHR